MFAVLQVEEQSGILEYDLSLKFLLHVCGVLEIGIGRV